MRPGVTHAAMLSQDAAWDGPYDDSWTRRVVAARHKAVFDSPEVSGGLALVQAWIYRAGYRAAMKSGGDEVVPVVVLRHLGTGLALDDAMWAKHRIGENRKINDPVTKTPAVRNPWSRRSPADVPDENVVALLGPDADTTVEGLVKSGAVVLACELAMRSFARGIAARSGGNADEVFRELRTGVVPGVIVQPSGVYATARAQEVGCTFMRSS